MHLTVSMITDLRSTRTILRILKKQTPEIKQITLPGPIFHKVKDEFAQELHKHALISDPQALKYNIASFSIYGIKILNKEWQ